MHAAHSWDDGPLSCIDAEIFSIDELFWGMGKTLGA
jgi:hypothetical protein